MILPGAAYPEKSALYVDTEGRMQVANRASFPPGDAREDRAFLRALSDVLGKAEPYHSLPQLRQALFVAHPHFMRLDLSPPAMPPMSPSSPGSAVHGKAPLLAAVSEFYLTNPIARASATMAECSALANAATKTAAE